MTTPALEQKIAELRRLRSAVDEDCFPYEQYEFCDPREISGAGEHDRAEREYICYAANEALGIIDSLTQERDALNEACSLALKFIDRHDNNGPEEAAIVEQLKKALKG